MNGSHAVVCCGCMAADVHTGLQALGPEAPPLHTWQPRCEGHPLTEAELTEMLHSQEPAASSYTLVSGCCGHWLGAPDPGALPQRASHHRRCLDLVAPASLVDNLIAQGDYVVTGGWIVRWREHIQRWGFDQETARAFFAESTRRLVLLDTGATPQAADACEALAHFIGRPWARIPLGADYLRARVRELVAQQRLPAEDPSPDPAAAVDHAMALEALSELATSQGEDGAIDGLVRFSRMMFAADEATWWHLESGRPGRPRGDRIDPSEEARIAQALRSMGETRSAWHMGERGFDLLIGPAQAPIGLWSVGAVAFPEHLERYLNLALSVGRAYVPALRTAQAIDRALAAEALASSARERLSVTLDSIGEGVIATDAAGRISRINRVAAAMLGVPVADALGRPVTDLYRPVDAETGGPRPSLVGVALSENRIAKSQRHGKLAGDGAGPALIADTAAPIRDASGGVLGAVLVVRDVSDEVRLAREMERIARLESIAGLAGGVAHDFNNLLTAIRGNLGLAGAPDCDAEERAELMAEVDVAVDRAQQLARQFLTFARGGAPARSPADLEAIARDAASLAVRGSEVTLELKVAEPLWPVLVDPDQIHQALHGLATNGVQAMAGSGRLIVQLGNVRLPFPSDLALPAGDYVHAQVIDQGPGIALEQRDRIFEPFFSTRVARTGLGLPTAAQIIRRHGGHIRLSEGDQRGACFEVWLPAAPTAEPARPTPDTGPGERPQAGRGRLGGRVLIMDDEAPIRRVLVRMFGRVGCETVAVEDGMAAVQQWLAARAEGNPFDLMMLDLTVPGGMGGLETLQRIRAEDPDALAVVSSGYADSGACAEWQTHGFDGSLPKPYSPALLYEVVTPLLARARGRKD